MVSFYQDSNEASVTGAEAFAAILQSIGKECGITFLPVFSKTVAGYAENRLTPSSHEMVDEETAFARLKYQHRLQIERAFRVIHEQSPATNSEDHLDNFVFLLLNRRAEQHAAYPELIGEDGVIPQMESLLSSSVHQRQISQQTVQNMTLLKST